MEKDLPRHNRELDAVMAEEDLVLDILRDWLQRGWINDEAFMSRDWAYHQTHVPPSDFPS